MCEVCEEVSICNLRLTACVISIRYCVFPRRSPSAELALSVSAATDEAYSQSAGPPSFLTLQSTWRILSSTRRASGDKSASRRKTTNRLLRPSHRPYPMARQAQLPPNSNPLHLTSPHCLRLSLPPPSLPQLLPLPALPPLPRCMQFTAVASYRSHPLPSQHSHSHPSPKHSPSVVPTVTSNSTTPHHTPYTTKHYQALVSRPSNRCCGRTLHRVTSDC